MNSNKFIRVLSRIFRKKAFKLSMVGISLVGLLLSSGHSFAKYRDENYGGGNAGAAKFGSWNVEYTTTPIKIPDETSNNGIYAFIADFKVSFSEGEVKRAYTLKVKDVESSVDPANFNSVSARSGSYYYLSGTNNVWTAVKDDENNFVVVKDNVASRLTGGKYTSFAVNTIYLAYSEGQNSENAIDYGWNAYSSDKYVDNETSSVYITDKHEINPNESDYHYYRLIYFMDVDVDNINNFKFIYSLSVEQVI